MAINHYYVEISDGGMLSTSNRFEFNEHEVIGENDLNIVIDDINFTTISKKKREYRTSLDNVYINLYVSDKVFGNRVIYNFYSYEQKNAKTIKSEIEKEIKRKFGFFINGIDLSIIK